MTPALQKKAARWTHVAALAALWAALISAPYWMPLFGGYTALGTRVLPAAWFQDLVLIALVVLATMGAAHAADGH